MVSQTVWSPKRSSCRGPSCEVQWGSQQRFPSKVASCKVFEVPKYGSMLPKGIQVRFESEIGCLEVRFKFTKQNSHGFRAHSQVKFLRKVLRFERRWVDNQKTLLTEAPKQAGLTVIAFQAGLPSRATNARFSRKQGSKARRLNMIRLPPSWRYTSNFVKVSFPARFSARFPACPVRTAGFLH